MCLVTDQLKPTVTTEDLTVYKMVRIKDGIISSPFINGVCEWDRGVLKRTRLKVLTPELLDCIFADSRSYDHYYTKYNKTKGIKIIMVSRGFNACLTRERANFLWAAENWKVIEALVPKGAKIFTDETGLIISNKMMVL